MGIQVDHNKPYTPEIKDYLRQRGRGYLIPANERRFGEDGTRQPEEHEQADNHAISPFYNSAQRNAAVYDQGGAPLPNTTLDYNTGRVADRDNGVLVEPSVMGHVPGAYDLRVGGRREPEGFSGYDIDSNGNPIDDHIDEDIVEHVVGLPNKAALVAEMKQLRDAAGIQVSANKDDTREDLETKLGVAYQDFRDAGGRFSFVDDEENSDEDSEEDSDDSDNEDDKKD